MAALKSIPSAAGLRARRWDVVVLGSGTAALMASARLGMSGRRVLIVEEEAARSAFPGLREPFFLAGARDGGMIDTCLRELKLALIDRRRVAPEPIAFQVVESDARIDVGEAGITADELVAWGCAKPQESRALVRSLADAAEAELKAMLGATVVRPGRKLGRAAAAIHARGLPSEAAGAEPAVARLLAAQIRALSNLATQQPSPEARARLLGVSLAGGASFQEGPPWLSGLLRRRCEAVYGELRSVSGPFELVSVAGQPGIETAAGEIWLGRALVLGSAGIAAGLADGPLPSFLRGRGNRGRRLAVHMRAARSVIPEGMAARVILLGEAAEDVTTLATLPGLEDGDEVDLIARMVLEEGVAEADGEVVGLADAEARVEARVRSLLPFSEGRLVRRPVRRPVWDDDDWLEDPREGKGWPTEIDLRVSARPPVYLLDRSRVAGLGVEGDLLLGWRAGDAIAAGLGH